jgi:hypothetical protein
VKAAVALGPRGGLLAWAGRGRRTQLRASAPPDSAQRRVRIDPREARSRPLILVAPARLGYTGCMSAVPTAPGHRQHRGLAAFLGCGLASAATLGSLPRAGAQGPAQASQPIQAVPPRVAPQLPTQPALGPFASLQAYCASLARSGAGHCDASLNDFAPGWQRGARGPFLSATTLRVWRIVGPHRVATCHLALRTRRGWYLSSQLGVCEGQARGEVRHTSLAGLRWADEAGMGVVSSVRTVERTLQVAEHRWWGQAQLETTLNETQAVLCGMGPGLAPACSATLATTCGLEPSSLLHLEQGQVMSSLAAVDARAACGGEVLPPGSYALPFLPGPTPFHQQRAKLASSETTHTDAVSGERGETVPAEARLLYGPFPSVAAFCKDPATFFDPFREHDIEQDDEDAAQGLARGEAPVSAGMPDPTLRLAACERGRGDWSSRELTAASGLSAPIRRVQLLRLHERLAGVHRVEQCRVTIATSQGVFVSEDTEPCQGVIGPDQEVRTRLRALRWLPGREGRVFQLEEQRELSLYGAQRYARLCGVGPSGVPSCSVRYPLYCRDEQGASVPLEVGYSAGSVRLEPAVRAAPSADLAPDPDWACSDWASPLPLVFP